MSYSEFRDVIRKQLVKDGSGLTWKELRDSLKLPYDRPCPEWTKKLEKDIGLERKEKRGNALLWKLRRA